MPVGRGAMLGAADGDAVSKVVLVVVWAAGELEGWLANTRLDCVKNENSGLMVCEDCFVLEAGAVKALLPPVGKLIDGVDDAEPLSEVNPLSADGALLEAAPLLETDPLLEAVDPLLFTPLVLLGAGVAEDLLHNQKRINMGSMQK